MKRGKANADVARIVHLLGGLHDVVVSRFEWNPVESRIEISTQDLFAAYKGLIEYFGAVPATLTFCSVTKLTVDFNALDGSFNVYDVLVAESAAVELRITIKRWPQGTMEINCSGIDIPDNLRKKINSLEDSS